MGTVLTIVRTATGLSQLDLGTLLGWSQSQVARIEAGQRDTLFDVRELLRVTDTLDMPREALAPLLLGTPNATLSSSSDSQENDDRMDRRTFTTGLLAAIGFGAGLDRVQVPERVDLAHVRFLQAGADRLRQRDQQIGGATLVRDGLRQYHRSRRMLEESDFAESVGRSLVSASGQLAYRVGWLAYDAGDQRLARDLYAQALLLAQEADDAALSIMALQGMTLQSVFLARRDERPGVARQAIRTAVRASELARHERTPRLHALLASREAIAYAANGDEGAYRSAISRAYRELDAGASIEDPTWLQFVIPAELRVAEAKGRIYLGDPAGAVRLYEESLAETDLSPRNRLNYRAQKAAALALSGDHGAAVREGLAILPELEEQVASPRTLSELQPVRDAAAHIGNDEFCNRWDTAMGDGSSHVRV
jgi:transcriptional regulator with XRE-family HTH domain